MVVVALADDARDGDFARARLRGERLSVPELLDLEVASVPPPADQPLLATAGDVTVYDAAYVALAEALDVTLLTGHRRLAGATGPECHIELLTPS